ncbi:MAG: hypothetical protein M1370_07415 [Bacteroidetes bacterium]|nr:hypothetical protein [Bacteroidota bacterium]
METVHIQGNPAVRIPYFDTDGVEVAARLRLTLTGKDRFRWRKGSKTTPYGLWKLGEVLQCCSVAAGDNTPPPPFITLVEGESDAQTLWHYGIPALGAPGASTWKPEWAKYLEGLRVYAWQEPGAGGETFIQKIGASIPEAHILTPSEGRKDISECHILGDDVPAVVQKLMAQARPYSAVQAEALNTQATAAKETARWLLNCPDILNEVTAVCTDLGVVGEDRNTKLLYLAVTSRLLGRPISVAVKGTSASGKSYTVETVLRTFPGSAYYALSSMSDRALAYSQEPLSHRMLVLYEAAGLTSDFGTYLMRTLLSEGHIRYETVEKTDDGLKPRLIEREGPTGLIVTTTWASLHPENETRMLSLLVRDDNEQTRAIMQSLAERANGRLPKEPDLSPYHSLQTWLELAGCREVTIPYAYSLATLANPKAVRLRRDFGALLNLVRAHAILHQCTRERDEAGRIVATLADYRAVYDLVADLLSEGVGATVSKAQRETVAAVKELSRDGEMPVTLPQLAQYLELDKSAASRRARVAIEHGYLENLETHKGKPHRLVPGDPLPEESGVLPHPDLLQEGGGGVYPLINTATVQQSGAGGRQSP